MNFFRSKSFYQTLFTFFLINCLASFPSGATLHHSKKTRHDRSAKPSKIILTPQPNNAFSTIAYQLNKIDIDFAIRHGETPLVLIGSLNLSSTRKIHTVLFTQLQSASLCGSGGCTTTAYLKRNNQWVKVLDSVTGDIEVKRTAHKGMHDLLVGSSDLWIWNNDTYVENQSGPNVNGLKKSIQNYQQHKQ